MATHTVEVRVHFNCQHCGKDVSVRFLHEQTASASCGACGHVHNVSKPMIGEEVMLDWHGEAVLQKIRAEKIQEDIVSLMLLVVQVIELLTWRDQGNGQAEAIRTMREWLINNGVPRQIAELIISPSDNTPNIPR